MRLGLHPSIIIFLTGFGKSDRLAENNLRVTKVTMPHLKVPVNPLPYLRGQTHQHQFGLLRQIGQPQIVFSVVAPSP